MENFIDVLKAGGVDVPIRDSNAQYKLSLVDGIEPVGGNFTISERTTSTLHSPLIISKTAIIEYDNTDSEVVVTPSFVDGLRVSGVVPSKNVETLFITSGNDHTNYDYTNIASTKLKHLIYGDLRNTGESNYYVGRYFNCKSLESVYLPEEDPDNLDSFSSTGIGSFQDCTNLSHLSRSNYIRTLGMNAFRNTALTNINCPNVKSVGGYAFYNCKATTLTVYNTCKSIGSYAYVMNSLERVIIYGTPSISPTAFGPSVKSITLYGSRSDYSNEPWGATNAEIVYRSFAFDGEVNVPIDAELTFYSNYRDPVGKIWLRLPNGEEFEVGKDGAKMPKSVVTGIESEETTDSSGKKGVKWKSNTYTFSSIGTYTIYCTTSSGAALIEGGDAKHKFVIR